MREGAYARPYCAKECAERRAKSGDCGTRAPLLLYLDTRNLASERAKGGHLEDKWSIMPTNGALSSVSVN
jgi:hypothetical protein